ncbi:MAG: XRE family transcriptional regulator [Oscillospiraceae bacterium]|nr:XRE family transcriptional regulator [Oscillospiraceae bacterium]
MAGKLKRKGVLERLEQIAFGSSNDVVKLAFTDEESEGDLDSLDLTLLSEIKRTNNGTVEVKLIDRLKMIELLLRELEEPQVMQRSKGAEALFTAIDRAAGKVSDDN